MVCGRSRLADASEVVWEGEEGKQTTHHLARQMRCPQAPLATVDVYAGGVSPVIQGGRVGNMIAVAWFAKWTSSPVYLPPPPMAPCPHTALALRTSGRC